MHYAFIRSKCCETAKQTGIRCPTNNESVARKKPRYSNFAIEVCDWCMNQSVLVTQDMFWSIDGELIGSGHTLL